MVEKKQKRRAGEGKSMFRKVREEEAGGEREGGAGGRTGRRNFGTVCGFRKA